MLHGFHHIAGGTGSKLGNSHRRNLQSLVNDARMIAASRPVVNRPAVDRAYAVKDCCVTPKITPVRCALVRTFSLARTTKGETARNEWGHQCRYFSSIFGAAATISR